MKQKQPKTWQESISPQAQLDLHCDRIHAATDILMASPGSSDSEKLLRQTAAKFLIKELQLPAETSTSTE